MLIVNVIPLQRCITAAKKGSSRLSATDCQCYCAANVLLAITMHAMPGSARTEGANPRESPEDKSRIND